MKLSRMIKKCGKNGGGGREGKIRSAVSLLIPVCTLTGIYNLWLMMLVLNCVNLLVSTG